jgi:hypothetical protein
MPGQSEVLEDALLDLSGNTTFLDLSTESTEATAQQLYDDIVSLVPGVIGANQDRKPHRHYSICRTHNDAHSWRLTLLRPVVPSATSESGWVEIADVEGIGLRMVIGVIQHGAYSPPFRPHLHTYDARLTSGTKHPIQMLRGVGGLPVDNLWLSLSFQTRDEHGRKLAADIDRIVVERYPAERILALDINDRKTIPEKSGLRLLDPKILEWVKGNKHRWLSAHVERFADSWRYFGYRPEKAE